MKFFHPLLLICAAFLAISPAYAHGDEVHGEAPKVTQTQAEPHNMGDMGDMGDMEGMHSSEMSPSVNDAANIGAGADAAHDNAGSESAAGPFGFLTKLHPTTVHFPVALFLMAALAELFVMTGRTGIESSVRVMIYGGAAGSVLAALFGWIHTGLWFGGDTIMQVHRWNGMFITVLGLALAALARRNGDSRTLLRTGLGLMAVLIIAQGFLGGELAHGQNHLGLSWL